MIASLRRARNLFHYKIYVPVVLFILAVISYGLLIPSLGYYGDDWSMSWLAYQSHHLEIFFGGNRLLLAYYYEILTSVLGPAPWHWQVYALVWHWLSAVVFWRLVSAIWPLKREMAVVAAALFLLYPGFLMTSEAMTLHLAFLQLTIFLGSLLATVYSLRRPHQALLWTILALVGAFLNLAISEYWFFLELLRPALIWFELAHQETDYRRKGRRTLLRALPFLAVFAGFLLIRAFNVGGINSGHALTFFSELKNNPLSAVLGLISQVISNLWVATLGSFGSIFAMPGLSGRSPAMIALLLVLLLTTGFLFFLWLRRQESASQDHLVGAIHPTAQGYLLVGVACLLLAGPPIWITSLHVSEDVTSTHLTLPFMPGACLFVVGLVSLVFLSRMKTFLYSILIAFSIVFQILTGSIFVREKQLQETFLWQLSQRIPSLKPGTQLLTGGLGLDLNGENSNSAMVNWMYTPSAAASQDLQYYLYQYPERVQEAMDRLYLNRKDPQLNIFGYFSGRYQVALLFHPGSCLRVLNPELDIYNGSLPPHLRNAAEATNYGAIQPALAGAGSPRPPVEVFGNKPPPDNWCTAFEKASLAAQMGDWAQVTDIGGQAFGRGFKPNNGMELAVFIEGYARHNDWKRSAEFLRQALKLNPELFQVFCYLKQRLPVDSQPSKDQQKFLDALQCKDVIH